MAHGDRLPEVPGVAAALLGLGLSRETSQILAPAILSEVFLCLEDPFLKNLLSPDSAVSEWGLEDQPAPGVIRRGRLDLLAFDGRDWWLVDFKSSRPPSGVSWEDFLAHEQEKYRPQLLSYKEMTARVKSLEAPEDIRLALYFTACQKMVEL